MAIFQNKSFQNIRIVFDKNVLQTVYKLPCSQHACYSFIQHFVVEASLIITSDHTR